MYPVGLCVTTNRKSVTFGENAISGCILPEGGNFSSNCSQLISVAMPYLVDSSLGSNVYISSFGKVTTAPHIHSKQISVYMCYIVR